MPQYLSAKYLFLLGRWLGDEPFLENESCLPVHVSVEKYANWGEVRYLQELMTDQFTVHGQVLCTSLRVERESCRPC